MSDDLTPPVTSTPVGLIGVSDKDASGYDHKADPLDLDALAEVARKATPGPWWTGMHDGFSLTVEGPNADSHPVAQRLIRPDAEHIATFSPPTVLALLDALKEAQADNVRLTQLAEGRSKLGLLAVYMSDVMGDADMVAARDAYLADVWDAGWHEHYLEMDRQKRDRFHPITKTNPYRNGGTK